MFCCGACPFHTCFNLQKMTVESGTSKIVGFRFSSASFICLISNEILHIVAHYLCQPKHHFNPLVVLSGAHGIVQQLVSILA